MEKKITGIRGRGMRFGNLGQLPPADGKCLDPSRDVVTRVYHGNRPEDVIHGPIDKDYYHRELWRSGVIRFPYQKCRTVFLDAPVTVDPDAITVSARIPYVDEQFSYHSEYYAELWEEGVESPLAIAQPAVLWSFQEVPVGATFNINVTGEIAGEGIFRIRRGNFDYLDITALEQIAITENAISSSYVPFTYNGTFASLGSTIPINHAWWFTYESDTSISTRNVWAEISATWTPAPETDPGTVLSTADYEITTDHLAERRSWDWRNTYYGVYHQFTLAETTTVLITLEWNGTAPEVPVDTYMLLISGDNKWGEILEENDDYAGLSRSSDSGVQRQLQPGTYTIECTTYNPETTGHVRITVQV